MAFLALIFSVGGFAIAAAPSSDAIRACVNKKTGVLRVLAKGRKCNQKRERSLSWNRTGVAGASGQGGATGQAGATGAAGPAGSDAQFNGAAAGGDLQGTYPSPTLKAGVVDSDAIAPDAITGAQINESTLSGLDADELDGLPRDSYVWAYRGTSGVTPGQVALRFNAFRMDTVPNTTAQYGVGGNSRIERTTTDGDINLCTFQGVTTTFPYVIYNGATRSTGTLGGSDCVTIALTSGADFRILIDGAHVVGSPSPLSVSGGTDVWDVTVLTHQ